MKERGRSTQLDSIELGPTRMRTNPGPSTTTGSQKMRVWTSSVDAPSSRNEHSNETSTVDFESTLMRLGDEKNLRVNVAKALIN